MHYGQRTCMYCDHSTCMSYCLACTMIIVYCCTVIIVHACTMIRIHACTMIIGHAFAMVIVHVSFPTGLMFGEIWGGPRGRSPSKAGGLRAAGIENSNEGKCPDTISASHP